MPIGCIIHDKHNRFSEMNPAAEHIFGYTAAELLGQHASVLGPAARQTWTASRRLAERRHGGHSVHDNVTKDGRIITCQWTNTPLRDAQGACIGFLSMVQDVTGEETGPRNFARERGALPPAGGAQRRHHRAARSRRHGALRQPVARPPRQLAGLAALVASRRPARRSRAHAANVRGESTTVEYRHRRPGRLLGLAGNQVRSSSAADGKPRQRVLASRNITDASGPRKRCARERLLQDVIDGSPSPIFLKDRDGKFITINASLERMLGIPRDEIKGKTDYDIASQEVADYWRTHDTKVMATGKAIQIEETADLQDGHHVFLANKFPLVDAAGQVYGVGAISHDITERKRAEEALRRAMNG